MYELHVRHTLTPYTNILGIQHIESDFSDDECGFTVVSRPKPYAPVHPEEPMSSPTPVVDILKATGTDYSDDDDWTML
jgi:hypothetical protein